MNFQTFSSGRIFMKICDSYKSSFIYRGSALNLFANWGKRNFYFNRIRKLVEFILKLFSLDKINSLSEQTLNCSIHLVTSIVRTIFPKLNQRTSFESSSTLTFPRLTKLPVELWHRELYSKKSRRNCSHPSKLPWKLVGICCSWCCRRADSRRLIHSRVFQKRMWWTRRRFVWEDRPCISSPTCTPAAEHGKVPSTERSRWQQRLELKANSQCYSDRCCLCKPASSLLQGGFSATFSLKRIEKTLKTNKNIYSMLALCAYFPGFISLSATKYFHNNFDGVPVLREHHSLKQITPEPGLNSVVRFWLASRTI